MNTDAIEAADILVAELSEQAAQLSEAGVTALSGGHLREAKAIIDAIEQTQALQNRAQQIKADIAVLLSGFTPELSPDGEAPNDPPYYPEQTGRKQERTDPTEMNRKKETILRKLEAKFNVRLRRRSAALYRSDADQVGIVCAMSKWHANNENYWYAYHTHQHEFLTNVGNGHLVLGMMDAQRVVVLPFDVLRQNLDKLNTTTAPDRLTYWHIHVSRDRDGNLSLMRARGEPALPLDRYVVNL